MLPKAQSSLEYLMIAVVAIVLVAGSFVFINSQSTSVSDYSELTADSAAQALCDTDIYFCSSAPATIELGGIAAGDASPSGNTWTYHIDDTVPSAPSIIIDFTETVSSVAVELRSDPVDMDCSSSSLQSVCTYPASAEQLTPGNHKAYIEAEFEDGKIFSARISFRVEEPPVPEYYELPTKSFTQTADGISGKYEKDGEILDFYATREELMERAPDCSSGVLGDVDGNGLVNFVDFYMVINEFLRFTSHYPTYECLDVNGDGSVDSGDSMAIAQIILSAPLPEYVDYLVENIGLDGLGTNGTYEKDGEIFAFETNPGDFIARDEDCSSGILGDVDANGIVNMVDVQMIIDESLDMTNYFDDELCRTSFSFLCYECFDLDGSREIDEGDIEMAIELCLQDQNGLCSAQSGEICESYEVCDGEVLDAAESYRCCSGECKLPESFDWRDRHGKIWLSQVHNQGYANSCIYFAWIGALEAQILLYYNQEGTIWATGISNALDWEVDLSEQMLMDCVSGGCGTYEGQIPELASLSCREGECLADEVLCRIMKMGIVDQECDDYRGGGICTHSCTYDYLCDDYDERTWKMTDYHRYILDDPTATTDCDKETIVTDVDELKAALIEHGPMWSGIRSAIHSMVLAGYDGQVDWLTTEECDWMCVNSECISRDCEVLGDEMSFCSNVWYTPTIEDRYDSFTYTYVCEEKFGENRWVYEGREECPEGMACVDGVCADKSLFDLTEGYATCSNFINTQSLGDGGDASRFLEISEFRPGEGDTVWIFKNSLGLRPGTDPGYRIEAVSLFDLSEAVLLKGSVIPPSNEAFWPGTFDNQINCVDEDGDNFCNWGITEEMPATCPENCLPVPDWDDSDPNVGALGSY